MSTSTYSDWIEKFISTINALGKEASLFSSVTKHGIPVNEIVLSNKSFRVHWVRSMTHNFELHDKEHETDPSYNFSASIASDNDVEPAAKKFVNHLDSLVSTEAANMDIMKQKRATIEKMIYDTVQIMDPSGDNTKRWQDIFSKMSDAEFGKFIEKLRNKEVQLNIVMPNMKKVPKIPDLVKAAEKVGLTLAHRLWLPDKTRPGKRYLTNEKYLVLELPIRRAQQEWDKKLQVPSRDTHVDALTGQVIMDDRACHLSTPEIQALATRGLDATLSELVKVRGGDVMAYGDFKRQLEESGEANISSLDPRTRARSGILAKVLLQSMLIDNNL